MASDNPSHVDSPPASTYPLQRDEEFGFHITQNEAADFTGIFDDGNGRGDDLMDIPFMSLPVAPFPWETYQSYSQDIVGTGSNLMADSNQLNSLWNPRNGENSIDISGNMPFLCRPVPVFPCPEGTMNGTYQSHTHDNMVTADNAANGVTNFNSFQNPQIDRNFLTTRGNAAGGFQMTRSGGEAKSSNIHRPQTNRNFVSESSNIHRPQTNRNFVSVGGSSPVLYRAPNCGEIGIDNNVTVSSVQSDSAEKIDGSFLTLGIGGNTEARSKSNVKSRKTTRRNEKAVFPQLKTSHEQQGYRSSLNPGNNLAGDLSSFQNKVGGLSSLDHNVGGWTSSNSDPEVLYGTNAEFNSRPFHIFQTPQVDMQHYFPMPSNRTLGPGGNKDARLEKLECHKAFQDYAAASSRPFSSSQAGLLDSGQAMISGLPSESANITRITSQPTSDQLQKCHMKTVRSFSPLSSMVSPFVGTKGNLARKDQSEQRFPTYEGSATQAVEGGIFPQTIGVQSARSLFPVNRGSPAQAAEGGLLPKRIELQPASKLCRPENSGPVQSPKYLVEPSFTAGQVVPAAKRNGSAQTSNVLVEPSLKRTVIQPSPATTIRARRRKILPQASYCPSMPPPAMTSPSPTALMPTASIHPSMPSPAMTALARIAPIPRASIRPSMPSPAMTAPVPTAPASQIKWQGFERPPQAIGVKCMLCKRDLSYTPEGPVYQPIIPPPVAVLPCSHIFHDHCLQLITPEDQSKNPPCIPCALGEF